MPTSTPLEDPHAALEAANLQTPPSAEAGAFFDRAGLVWIAACIAIAALAGHWIPRLSEPTAWRAPNGASRAVLALSPGASQHAEKAADTGAAAAAGKPLTKLHAGLL